MLIHTYPANEAEAAVIARSRQLTDFEWTPVRDVPTYTRNAGNTVLEAGVTVKGFPYSSEERNDKFFCENVSLESFLSAIPNPYSKLYQPGHGALDTCNYGIVCNGLARYALGIRRRVSTALWYTIPGMNMVKECGKYTADEIRLCDVIHVYGNGRSHVALITDILRREDGTIAEIEVSEAVRPSCRRASYTVEEYFEKYKLFSLCRYEYLNEVPLLDEKLDDLLWNSGIDKIAPKIAVDNGNHSNYLYGDEVVISANVEGGDTVEILREGKLVEEIRICAKAVFPRKLPRGYYTVRLKNDGAEVAFAVCQPTISHTVENGEITVCASSNDKNSEILYMDFRVEGMGCASLAKYEEITAEERSSGIIKRKIPSNGKNFKVYFQNQYGIWTKTMTKIV